MAVNKPVNDTNIKTLYYLLYANFCNSPIANYDEYQFRVRLFSIVFQYGPAWEKRLEIQKRLKNYSIDDISQGTKIIYNHAYNPGTEPSTGTLNELDYINEQNVNNYKRSPLEADQTLWAMIRTDVSQEFIDRFKSLFLRIVEPQITKMFVFDTEEEFPFEERLPQYNTKLFRDIYKTFEDFINDYNELAIGFEEA